jgi:hypothetical protein
MTKAARNLVVAATVAASLMAPQAFAQAPTDAPAAPSACLSGTQYVPARRDGAGNLIAAYCAFTPTGPGTYDPYTGRGAADPQLGRGPGQSIPSSK